MPAVRQLLIASLCGSALMLAGTVSCVAQQQPALTTLHAFGASSSTDGAGPVGGLILMHDTLYGTTSLGGVTPAGNEASGTIFSINTDGTGYAILHNFLGARTYDGAGPHAGLTQVGDVLFGTTFVGGKYDLGVLFEYHIGNGRYFIRHYFRGGRDGSRPGASLIYANGVLYGTTTTGGSGGCFDRSGCGTVFSYDITTRKVTILHEFAGGAKDGSTPKAPLLLYNNVLYGTASTGGGTGCFAGLGCGTVFAIGLSPSSYTQLYAFSGGPGDGADPVGGLVEGPDGVLVGTTAQGGGGNCGQAGCGTVYQLDPFSGPGVSPVTILSAPGSFGNASGTGFGPIAELSTHRGYGDDAERSTHRGVVAFGVTQGGGTLGKSTQDQTTQGCDTSGRPAGTIFRFALRQNETPVTLTTFTGENCLGSRPSGGLVGRDHAAYGVTFKGGFDPEGLGGSGTVFKLQLQP